MIKGSLFPNSQEPGEQALWFTIQGLGALGAHFYGSSVLTPGRVRQSFRVFTSVAGFNPRPLALKALIREQAAGFYVFQYLDSGLGLRVHVYGVYDLGEEFGV